MRIVVDLPAPLEPSRPTIVEGVTEKLTALTALCVPKDFDRSRVSISVIGEAS